jgi:hypothetical protein
MSTLKERLTSRAITTYTLKSGDVLDIRKISTTEYQVELMKRLGANLALTTTVSNKMRDLTPKERENITKHADGTELSVALGADLDGDRAIICLGVTNETFVDKPAHACSDNEISVDLIAGEIKDLSTVIKRHSGLLTEEVAQSFRDEPAANPGDNSETLGDSPKPTDTPDVG